MYIIIIIVLIGVITYLEKKIQTNNPSVEETMKANAYKEDFEKKEYLLTPTELKFYKLLKSITDELGYTLFSQIALYEIVNCKNFKTFNRIKSKTIDFVITEKNCKIKLCIELDDKTHNTNKRIERDNFINDMFKELNIKLLRVPVQNFYNMEELKQKIQESV